MGGFSIPGLLIALILIGGFPGEITASDLSTKAIDFQKEIRPILSDNCFACHGPDDKSRLGNLRLDTRKDVFSHRSAGYPIVPGDSDSSLIYQRITAENPGRRMPPVFSNKKLTEEQINIIKRWIKQGAVWNQHWSFQPLERPNLPSVKNKSWVRNDLDHFVLRRLEAEDLKPSQKADRRTLARRVSLDLIGLPPQPAVVEGFVNDSSADAYEQLVDQLLASSHWGEHRARYWLDAARYADTHGLHIDNYREMWPYRDWVINAFNHNMPFDQFTVEQIAGDLLPNPSLGQLIATGFHRCAVTTNEGGAITDEVAAMYAKERVETTGQVWLGLTTGCAACHDHKFDPISQKDFYSMSAFFRNTTQDAFDGNISDPPPIITVPGGDDQSSWLRLKQKLDNVRIHRRKVLSSAGNRLRGWLATGDYRSLEAPIEKSSTLLSLQLQGNPQVWGQKALNAVELHGGATLGVGQEVDRQALFFSEQSWATLPSLKLEKKSPFSITLWIYHPEENINFVVASQTEAYVPQKLSSEEEQSSPNQEALLQAGRGWVIAVDERDPKFTMIDDEGKIISVSVGHMHRLEAGKWSHLAITYDGTGERAGLNFYVNGKVVPTQGTGSLVQLEGTIHNNSPLLLGKQDQGDATVYFPEGGISDFQIFNRAITVEEARLISLRSALKSSTHKELSELSEQELAALELYYLTRKNQEYRDLTDQLQALEFKEREIRRRGGITHVMKERKDQEPAAHVLYRGMYDQPRERVAAATPRALPPMEEGLPLNRLGLARWLVNDSNPLTARVAVNRYWQQIFGTGIVKTSEDFGAQGEPPSHPQLLDWLAIEFRESEWDIKKFFKMLVTSATYLQSATTTKIKLEKDPQNRLLSRGARFRLDGEQIRDYALAASGLLVPEIGGPSVKPYQPQGVWETVAMTISNTRIYNEDKGNKLYRRSLYTFWKRLAPPASMQIFDAPTRETHTVRRERTNTPLQALVTLNDPQFVEASRYLAQRALREAYPSLDHQIDYLTSRLLGRKFKHDERDSARQTYADLLTYYKLRPEDARNLLATGATIPDSELPEDVSAALTVLASQIMNLDETLNK